MGRGDEIRLGGTLGRAGEYEHQILSGTKEEDLAAFAAIVERERIEKLKSS